MHAPQPKAKLVGVDSLWEDISTLRAHFDAFIKYNEERVHEGLGSVESSPRAYTGRIVPYEYDNQALIRNVRPSRKSSGAGVWEHASTSLAEARIALLPYGDGVWEVRYRFHPFGFLNGRTGRIESLTQWRKIARPPPSV